MSSLVICGKSRDKIFSFFGLGCVVAASVGDDCEQWLRALVISRPGENGEVQLRSLDHGFPFTSRASCLKFLPLNFCVTAVQAIECRVVSGRFGKDFYWKYTLLGINADDFN